MISRGYVHFKHILPETKLRSAKFRIRWSKVPRILGPLNRAMAILVTQPAKSSYGHFSHPAGHGRGKFSSREITQNDNKSRFPGATCIFANFARQNRRAPRFRLRWSKVPRVLGPLNPVMAISGTRPVTAGGSFQAEKSPKMAIDGDFPGLRAFLANFGRYKIEECEIPHRMVKSAVRFGAPKPSYGHFSHPAGHNRGKFSSQKSPKMAISRDFPGLRAFSVNSARDNIEEREIPHPMVKSVFWGP